MFESEPRAMKASFWQQYGLLKSILIYYGIPFRMARLGRFYAQFVEAGDLCFDVGAHVGSRLRIFTRLGARVVGIEPLPHCFRLLERWYGDHPGIELVPEAVGAAPGIQTIHVSRRNPTVSSLSGEWVRAVGRSAGFAGVRWEADLPVPVTTLDRLMERYGEPAFCKIDVEGYELEVLRGLSRPLQALSFEYNPATVEIALGCVERLETLGRYEYNWTVGEFSPLQGAGWLAAGEMVERLERMPKDGQAGDVYARRVTESIAPRGDRRMNGWTGGCAGKMDGVRRGTAAVSLT